MTNPKFINNVLQPNQRVKVYRNIRKKVFSVLDKKTGRLVAHSYTLVLTNVEFKISLAGQKKVRKEKQKHVHAYVIGDYTGQYLEDKINSEDYKSVYYNPYVTDTFIILDENAPIFLAEKCYLIDGKCYIDK